MTAVKSGIGVLGLVILIGCDGHRSVAPDQLLSIMETKRGSSGNAPSGLAAMALPGAIALSWADNAPNETGFVILRSSGGATGAFAAIATTGANATTYTDSPLAPQRDYCYQAQAVGPNGVIGTSNIACATTLPLPPSAAYDVSATLVNIWDIAVSWQDSSSNVTGYRLERAPTSAGPWATVVTVNGTMKFLDQHIPVEEQRCYRVVAFNGSGDGQPSNASCSAFPAPPTNVVAYSNDGRTITVTWTDASLYEDGYEIQRCCAGNQWTAVARLPANTTTYRDGGLTTNTRYTYAVIAKRDLGSSFWSSYASTVTADAPPPPTVVTAAPGGSWAIAVSWTQDPSASYRGERSLDNGATWQSIDPAFFANYPPMVWGPSSPMMWDSNRQAERSACYRMYAYNDRGQAPVSNTACTAPPAAPADLAVTTVDDQSVGLSWTDNSQVEDGYQVYYVEDDGFGDISYFLIATLDANATSYRVTGLASDSFYTFEVFATRDGGTSDPSNDAYVWTSVSPAVAASDRMSRSAVPSSWRGPVSAKLGQQAGLAISRRLMMKTGQQSKPAADRTIRQPSRKR
jgi:hypothetical protein